MASLFKDCPETGHFCPICRFGNPAYADQVEYASIYRASLVDLIGTMAKTEFPETIVESLLHQYDTQMRADISFVHPVSQEHIVAPPWSKSSIRNHVLFSYDAKQPFNESLDVAHRKILTVLKKHMISPDGEILREPHDMFLRTVNSYLAVQRHNTRMFGSSSGGGAAKKPHLIN